MKKKLTFILAVLITAAATGCDKIQDVVNNVQESAFSEAASDPGNNEDSEEDQENAVTSKKSYKKIYITDPNKKDKSKSKNDPDSSRQDDSDSKSESSGDGQDNNGSSGSSYSADALYQSAVDMYSSIILNCPYDLDYDDTDANGFAAISDSDVSGTDDVVSEYCTVFDQPDSYIYEKYIEKDGKVYYNDATRGSNIYYSGTDLEYVSGDENSMTFNAVSHYHDPETGEALEDKTATFSVKLTDNGYKVTEFKYPK